MMRDRIEQELDLLRRRYAEVDHREDGDWVRIHPVPTAAGWSKEVIPVAFQIPQGYPGTPPYGFYVPRGLNHQGGQPQSYQDLAGTQPPFPGEWGMFSWAHDTGWRPTGDIIGGSNLLNWTLSFADRFREGA
jgi:hypothetical protein